MQPARTRFLLGLTSAATVAVTAYAALPSPDTGPRLLPRGAYDPVRASASAADWATHADHVVVLDVTHEEPRGGPDAFGYRGRSVTARVAEGLWSREAAPALAADVTLRVDGWYEADGGGRREAGVEAASRIEPGHRYVVALVVEGRTAEPVGVDAVVPCDGGTVGAGEFEGRTVAPDVYRDAVERTAEDTVAEFLSTPGRTARDVRRLLTAASG
ncbi:hypothetical protein GCM10023347_45680 [Streptomyces chumphonensis]|uniref:Uncharacterized protein n=1 Tax=Streptomyces chumphonensis TaxID=1214925 RepID=A0A927EYV5_9ACTN|nr:hypothetical protein [Streptomyces chumphonensis]MBD3932171.1 hypothetical protein [Streptomyces chumphonensis]